MSIKIDFEKSGDGSKPLKKQYIYNLSDVKVIEEANCNLAFL